MWGLYLRIIVRHQEEIIGFLCQQGGGIHLLLVSINRCVVVSLYANDLLWVTVPGKWLFCISKSELSEVSDEEKIVPSGFLVAVCAIT